MSESDRIADLAAQVATGWREHVEYAVRVPVHGTSCSGRPGCACPEVVEKRVARVWQTSLVSQLEVAISERTSMTGGSGGRVRKVDADMPGNFDAYDLIVKIRRELEALVRAARIALGYDAPMKTLADMACGNCGGVLRVASDASTDVRCAGTEENLPCGTVYRRHEWVQLLKGGSAQ